ncbi:hypothetical protein COB21_03810 [Candidatus Aerophobetes bacterium]|uniref:OmpH family outer membrane protein n=1 Tax=Aerophobetes bacterium TaxID=2030807 RepID=A0A2A4X2K0_UNCAE|nr:MAG: hypothetical protein COB21_03810 [Candidatus Aerophobetes bacterium]
MKKNKKIKKSTLFIALLVMGGLILGNAFADNNKEVKIEEAVAVVAVEKAEAVEQDDALIDYKKELQKVKKETSNFINN